jgi:hypothetical protein
MFHRILEKPMAPPACCKICGAASDSEREYWVDTGTWEEFYGAVYYCAVCFEEIAALVGLIPTKEANRIKGQLEDARSEIRELKSSIAALSSLGIDVVTISGFVKDHPISLEEIGDGLGENIDRAATVVEQAASQGPNDVSDSKQRRKSKLDIDVG